MFKLQKSGSKPSNGGTRTPVLSCCILAFILSGRHKEQILIFIVGNCVVTKVLLHQCMWLIFITKTGCWFPGFIQHKCRCTQTGCLRGISGKWKCHLPSNIVKCYWVLGIRRQREHHKYRRYTCSHVCTSLKVIVQFKIKKSKHVSSFVMTWCCHIPSQAQMSGIVLLRL